jgi:tRNA(Ile)-lysidine synthase
MALLVAAPRCWPGQIEAATVDHGLRPEAHAEAEMVAGWCAGNGVPHAILKRDAPLAGNLQSAARAARYALLEAWQAERGLGWLMTAHQADDQIETIILRLNRGSGVGGLASVRGRRGHLLRPLLGERRAVLRDYCVEQHVPFVDDPRFDRVRLRQALAGSDLIAPVGLARSVEALAQADAALEWMAEQLADDFLDLGDRVAVLQRTALPPELLRRLLLRMVLHLNPEAEKPRGPSIDQALVQLLDARSVTLADCIITGGETWTSRRAPPRKSR